jgi:hypothetical protein
MPGDAPWDSPENLRDDEVADRLCRRQAYVEVDAAMAGRLAFVARAYRHDWGEALRVLGPLGGDPGVGCPVTEIMLGSAPARLRADVSQVRHQRLAGGGGDVARHYPGLLLAVLDRWHRRNRV